MGLVRRCQTSAMLAATTVSTTRQSNISRNHLQLIRESTMEQVSLRLKFSMIWRISAARILRAVIRFEHWTISTKRWVLPRSPTEKPASATASASFIQTSGTTRKRLSSFNGDSALLFKWMTDSSRLSCHWMWASLTNFSRIIRLLWIVSTEPWKSPDRPIIQR